MSEELNRCAFTLENPDEPLIPVMQVLGYNLSQIRAFPYTPEPRTPMKWLVVMEIAPPLPAGLAIKDFEKKVEGEIEESLHVLSTDMVIYSAPQ